MSAMKHFVNISDVDAATIEYLLNRAETLLDNVVKKDQRLSTLNGKIIANLFFEPSTRTQYSFTIAAHRLGAYVLNPHISHTSTVKGESLLDTARAFIAMGARLLVVRHSEAHIAEELSCALQNQACVVNAGDGCHQHPSQTLLDLLTIRQHKGDFRDLKIAIIGDIAHSRVARSLVFGLKAMGCSQIRLIAPDIFLPADIASWPVRTFSSMEEGLNDADVVMALRIQLERIKADFPDPLQYLSHFQLTESSLAKAHPQAIVMHPGPMNRGTEISAQVADGPQSVIFSQITNGVAVRMAIIEWLLS